MHFRTNFYRWRIFWEITTGLRAGFACLLCGFAALRETIFCSFNETFDCLCVTFEWPVPGPQRDPLPLGPRHSPLGRESPGILIAQLLGIDTVARERPAAEVMDEQVVSDGQLKPGPPRPFGEVILREDTKPEPLIEPTDLVVELPLHEQAKPRQLGHGEPLAAVVVAPATGDDVHLLHVVIAYILYDLRRCRAVRHRPRRGDGRCYSGQRDELLQPRIGHNDIVMQQHQVFPVRDLQPLVDGGRKPSVCGLAITVTGTAAASCTPAK